MTSSNAIALFAEGGDHALKMEAAFVEAFVAALVIREIHIPAVGRGQILVQTEACGVCHTDVHAANGDWPLKPTLPFIPGHEGIGRVVAIGADVTAVKEGDRVGVPWLYSACGHCEYCLSAWETVCPDAQFGGYTKTAASHNTFSLIQTMSRTSPLDLARKKPRLSFVRA